MNEEEFLAKFEEFNDEYSKSENLFNRLNTDDIINALLMMQPFALYEHSIVSGANHDVINLGVSMNKLLQSNPTDDFIKDMLRTGISYDSDYNTFYLFT